MITRLRDKALASNTSTATLAVAAIAVEAATMWPYLVGISLIATNGPGLPLDIFWLAFYNVLMILPAIILTWARTKYPAQTNLLLSKTQEAMNAAGSTFTSWLAIADRCGDHRGAATLTVDIPRHQPSCQGALSIVWISC